MKSPVQSVKQFTREVHKKVGKIFPRLVENEARKILDAGQPKPIESVKTSESPIARVDVITFVDTQTPCKKALEVYGSKVKAARALGIAETTFRDRLKKELATSGRFDDRTNPP